MVNEFANGESEAEIWAVAEPFAEKMLEAVSAKDIETFSADLTVRMRGLLTEEIFIEMVNRFERDYGRYQKRRQVCVMNNPHCTPVIWSINF